MQSTLTNKNFSDHNSRFEEGSELAPPFSSWNNSIVFDCYKNIQHWLGVGIKKPCTHLMQGLPVLKQHFFCEANYKDQYFNKLLNSSRDYPSTHINQCFNVSQTRESLDPRPSGIFSRFFAALKLGKVGLPVMVPSRPSEEDEKTPEVSYRSSTLKSAS